MPRKPHRPSLRVHRTRLAASTSKLQAILSRISEILTLIQTAPLETEEDRLRRKPLWRALAALFVLATEEATALNATYLALIRYRIGRRQRTHQPPRARDLAALQADSAAIHSLLAAYDGFVASYRTLLAPRLAIGLGGKIQELREKRLSPK